MLRILLCLVVLGAFVTCNPHWPGEWGGHHHEWGHPHHDWGNHGHHHHHGCGHSFEDSDLFNDFADELIRFDRRVQTLCNSQYKVKELYNRENYEIVVVLQDFTENDIAVKIKHRLLEIDVQRYELSYKNLIVVPSMVNPQQARWNFRDKELHITMPYMFGQQNEIQRACDTAINEEVITVPKVDLQTLPLFDYRSNENELS